MATRVPSEKDMAAAQITDAFEYDSSLAKHIDATTLSVLGIGPLDDPTAPPKVSTVSTTAASSSASSTTAAAKAGTDGSSKAPPPPKKQKARPSKGKKDKDSSPALNDTVILASASEYGFIPIVVHGFAAVLDLTLMKDDIQKAFLKEDVFAEILPISRLLEEKATSKPIVTTNIQVYRDFAGQYLLRGDDIQRLINPVQPYSITSLAGFGFSPPIYLGEAGPAGKGGEFAGHLYCPLSIVALTLLNSSALKSTIWKEAGKTDIGKKMYAQLARGDKLSELIKTRAAALAPPPPPPPPPSASVPKSPALTPAPTKPAAAATTAAAANPVARDVLDNKYGDGTPKERPRANGTEGRPDVPGPRKRARVIAEDDPPAAPEASPAKRTKTVTSPPPAEDAAVASTQVDDERSDAAKGTDGEGEREAAAAELKNGTSSTLVPLAAMLAASSDARVTTKSGATAQTAIAVTDESGSQQAPVDVEPPAFRPPPRPPIPSVAPEEETFVEA